MTFNMCACMGPIGDDPMCPCAMRNAGLTPTEIWTPEKKAEFEAVMAKMFNWEEKDEENS